MEAGSEMTKGNIKWLIAVALRVVVVVAAIALLLAEAFGVHLPAPLVACREAVQDALRL